MNYVSLIEDPRPKYAWGGKRELKTMLSAEDFQDDFGYNSSSLKGEVLNFMKYRVETRLEALTEGL